MKFGLLDFIAFPAGSDHVAHDVRQMLERAKPADVYVAEIDPLLADTAAFCERYQIGMEVSANCVVVEARRAERIWYGACVVLATSRADINGVVRRQLDARKISFAPMEKATALTGMEFGGITSVGLPPDWPILVDCAVAAAERVVIGSGVRGSKLLVPGKFLASLPNAAVLDITKIPDR
jgi:prolyl-tRNA editing enzyme YbaK/EbsC (Cys-tRNA(Pro) deacylase)